MEHFSIFSVAVLLTTQLHPGQTFICGILAGMLASVVTQPADVIKTRLQLFPHHYSGNMDAVVCILKVGFDSTYYTSCSQEESIEMMLRELTLASHFSII